MHSKSVMQYFIAQHLPTSSSQWVVAICLQWIMSEKNSMQKYRIMHKSTIRSTFFKFTLGIRDYQSLLSFLTSPYLTLCLNCKNRKLDNFNTLIFCIPYSFVNQWPLNLFVHSPLELFIKFHTKIISIVV